MHLEEIKIFKTKQCILIQLRNFYDNFFQFHLFSNFTLSPSSYIFSHLRDINFFVHMYMFVIYLKLHLKDFILFLTKNL